MKITLIYPFYYSEFNIERKVELDETNIDTFINKHLNLYKFFDEYLTNEEIDQISDQLYQNYVKIYYKNGIKKKNAPEFDNTVKGNHLSTKMKKKDINDAFCPIFEGLKKTQDGKYIVKWGT